MGKQVYPYIPNSAPAIKAKMMKELGISDVEEIYAEIPERLRFKGKLNVPEPFLSELELRRHVEGLLSRNKNCSEYLNFLGGGCWWHYVPSVCKTIASRDEFLTAYVGDTYPDHGKFQALFEYASMMAELLDVDVVSCPTYDWANAAASALRMAARITQRNEVLLARTISPERLSVIRNFQDPIIKNIHLINFDHKSGLLDLDDLKKKITPNTAAIYFENPNFIGVLETQGAEISRIGHEAGAHIIVGVDPISLGVISPPSQYGADMTVGDLQPLGIPMYWGGGSAGFLGIPATPEYIYESPILFIGLAPSAQEGEFVYGQIYYERTSYMQRDQGKDFSGTTSNLYGIIAGVYLALMGPEGMRDIGETILHQSRYAISLLSKIKGVSVPFYNSPHFKEFIVNFDGTGKTVEEVNKLLLKEKIFGGKDLSKDFPELGNSALFCVTEMHTKEEINRLAQTIDRVCG